MDVAIYTAFTSTCDKAKELNGHVTTSFTWVKGRMPKLQTCQAQSISTVVEIVHFAGADVTVALVDSELAHKRYSVLKSIGLSYEHTYKPHITLCKGNKVADYTSLVGETVTLHSEYVGIFTKE